MMESLFRMIFMIDDKRKPAEQVFGCLNGTCRNVCFTV